MGAQVAERSRAILGPYGEQADYAFVALQQHLVDARGHSAEALDAATALGDPHVGLRCFGNALFEFGKQLLAVVAQTCCRGEIGLDAVAHIVPARVAPLVVAKFVWPIPTVDFVEQDAGEIGVGEMSAHAGWEHQSVHHHASKARRSYAA